MKTFLMHPDRDFDAEPPSQNSLFVLPRISS